MQTFLNNTTLTADVEVGSNIHDPLPQIVNSAGMFDGCTGLTKMPLLQSRKYWRYTQAMFKGCTNISSGRTAPFVPYWCQQMFMNCVNWNGEGIDGMTFNNVVNPGSCEYFLTNVPVDQKYLVGLLNRLAQFPPPVYLNNFDLGVGPLDAAATRTFDRVSALGLADLQHYGTRTPWDASFDAELAPREAAEDARAAAALPLTQTPGCGAISTSYMRGGLITPNYMLYANHFQPSAGTVITLASGEQVTIGSARHRLGETDAIVIKLAAQAVTPPMPVFDWRLAHQYWTEFGHPTHGWRWRAERFGASGVDGPKAFIVDRNNTMHSGNITDWLALQTDGYNNTPGGGVQKGDRSSFIVGDSGSFTCIYSSDGVTPLATAFVTSMGGAAQYISGMIDMIESLTGETVDKRA